MPSSPKLYVLTLTCPDRMGLVAEVAGFLARHDCNITSSSQFKDPLTGRFFMRACFDASHSAMSEAELERAFSITGKRLKMDWAMHALAVKKRLIVMVSRTSHCLVDILHRCQTGILSAETAAIVSNHPALKPHADFYEVPFHHLPVTPGNKPEQERKLLQLVEELSVDHGHTPEDLVRLGRNIEASVLARALTAIVGHRVLLNGAKTWSSKIPAAAHGHRRSACPRAESRPGSGRCAQRSPPPGPTAPTPRRPWQSAPPRPFA